MASGVSNPLQAVPRLVPGTLRRTMHIDVGPAAEWSDRFQELEIAGAARDVRGNAIGEPPTVITQESMRATFDHGRMLLTLETEPATDWPRQMVGQRAGGGFRRRLADVTPPGAEQSLLRQLLEDLPAAARISGYASLRLSRRRGSNPAVLTPPGVLDHMTDMCSGWRAGGTAVVSISASKGVPVQDTPAAPDLAGDDITSWHTIPTLAADWMRRRRLVDVTFDEGGTAASLWAMFRDSVGEPDGTEAVLHEYGLTGRIETSADGLVLTSLEADPRVLPFTECPAAALEVGALAGVLLKDLPKTVPVALFGVASCTHLNDLLRSIGGVAGAVSLAS
jgi:hypothetical protein